MEEWSWQSPSALAKGCELAKGSWYRLPSGCKRSCSLASKYECWCWLRSASKYWSLLP